MDMTPVINQFIKVLMYLIPLAIAVGFFKSPFFKGFIGEVIVNLLAKFCLDKNTYHLLKNVTLPTEDGTTQIDHIIVSKYGVFVVETKNMKGWIFGSEKQRQWTQKIFKHSTKFQNPLHQNYKHVKTLESALNLEKDNVFSVVVFVGDSKFKTPMPDNVTYALGYIRYIKSKEDVVLKESDVQTIVENIQSGRLKPSIKTHVQHVKHVKNIVEKKKAEIICPKCGNEMVLRTAKKGPNAGKEFFGCMGFPKCRTVKAVTIN